MCHNGRAEQHHEQTSRILDSLELCGVAGGRSGEKGLDRDLKGLGLLDVLLRQLHGPVSAILCQKVSY
jgi:hypothetical protein